MTSAILNVMGIAVWMAGGYLLRRRPLYAVAWFALFPVLAALAGAPVLGAPAIVVPLGLGAMLTYGLWGYVLLKVCGDRWVFWIVSGLMLAGISLGDAYLVVVFTAFLFWSVAELWKGDKLGFKVVLGFASYVLGVLPWAKFGAFLEYLPASYWRPLMAFSMWLISIGLMMLYEGLLKNYDLLWPFIASGMVYIALSLLPLEWSMALNISPHYALSAVFWLVTLAVLFDMGNSGEDVNLSG